MSIRVSNIQRFCLHDGSGIRTTVFLKGCNLHCPWCSNPENIPYDKVLMFRQDKCIGTNHCIIDNSCSILKDELPNLKDVNSLCPAISIVGFDIDYKTLFSTIIKDLSFFKQDGGVTFSGGEPLLQINELEPLLIMLKKHNINICVETSLSIKKNLLIKAINYIDSFFVDMKLLEETKAKRILGLNTKIYLDNLKFLLSKTSNVIIRMPIVPGFNNDERNITLIRDTLKFLKIKNVEIFSVHNLASDKYCYLGKKYKNFSTASKDELEKIKNKLSNKNINIKIIEL